MHDSLSGQLLAPVRFARVLGNYPQRNHSQTVMGNLKTNDGKI